MEMINSTKSWIAGLTEIGIMLLGLAIVASLLVGGSVPTVETITVPSV